MEGLPEVLTSGNYSFTVTARVNSAPALIEASFILTGNFSFASTDQATLRLTDSSNSFAFSIEDLTGDDRSDWVAKRKFEFYVAGNYTFPAELSLSVSQPSLFTIKEKSISVAPVSITFQLKREVDKHIEILEVDGRKIYCSELPVQFTWDFGSQHNVTWKQSVLVSSTQRLLLKEVTGIVSEQNASFYTPSSGGNITAEYSINYAVQFSVQGEGNISVLPGTYWIPENTSINVVPTPSEDTIFEKWLVNNVPISEKNLTVVVNEPLKIVAVFTKIIKVTFDAVLPEGAINGEEVILIVDDEEFTVGDLPQTFLWKPVSMHSFCWVQAVPTGQEGMRWAWHHSEGLKTSRRETAYFSSSGNITAFFRIEYLVSVTVSPPEGGRADPFIGERWIFENETIELSAVPSLGYHFQEWLINGGAFLNSTISLVVDQPYEIVLYFAKDE